MELLEELKLIKQLYGLVDICETAYSSADCKIYHLETINDVNNKEIESLERKLVEEEAAFAAIPEKNRQIAIFNEKNKYFSISEGLLGALYPFIFSMFFALVSFFVWLGDKTTFMLITTIVLFSISIVISIGSFILSGRQKHTDDKKVIDVSEETKKHEKTVTEIRNEIERRKSCLVDPKKVSKPLSNLRKVAKELKKGRDDTEKCLEEVIKGSTLHEHYSSFECVCQFIQYLDTGRCTTLEGPDGCYNKYELELRLGIIIGNLEEIKASLHRIEQSMYVIVKALEEISDTLDLISKEIDKLSHKMINPNTLENINKNLELTRACTAFLVEDKLPRDIRLNMVREIFLRQDYLN